MLVGGKEGHFVFSAAVCMGGGERLLCMVGGVIFDDNFFAGKKLLYYYYKYRYKTRRARCLPAPTYNNLHNDS